MTVDGFDVSSWQGSIQWERIPARYRFCGIKATEGANSTDSQFPRNWSSARALSLGRIAYHYFIPGVSGEAQADHLHSYVRNNGRFHVASNGYLQDAVMLDLEAPPGLVPVPQVIDEAEAFVTRILETTQCGVFLYSGYYFWRDTLGNPKSPLLHRCPLWLPAYAAAPPNTADIGWQQPAIWQYSESGSINGIAGNVDLDRFLGTLNQLKVLMALGGRK